MTKPTKPTKVQKNPRKTEGYCGRVHSRKSEIPPKNPTTKARKLPSPPANKKAAKRLLAEIQSRGIELETDGLRIRWRPAFMVNNPLAELIRRHSLELIALLTGPDQLQRCPACRWPLDGARRCAKCFDRLCVVCGKMTGSFFIQRCVLCGH
jgi:hypothetical protein